MSVAASPIPSPTVPPEPFGQTGVRQYFGRILAWLCLTVGLCAAAMAHRSGGFTDQLEWKGRGQTFIVSSIGGQFIVAGGTTHGATGDGPGWTYRSGSANRRWGAKLPPWQSSFGEVFGIEGALDPPSNEYDTGFWLRFRWLNVAVLFLLWPLLYVLLIALRYVRRSRDAD